MATTGIGPPSYNVVVNVDEKQAPGTQPPVQPVQYLPQGAPGGYPMQYVGQQAVGAPQPVPGYVYPQQQVTQGGFPVQQVQYMVPGAAVPPVDVTQRPSYKAPHSYLVLTMIVLGICCILNLTSLAFGIPALIMAIMANHSAAGGHYPKASTHGRIALFLTMANAGYTLFCAFIIIASVVGSANHSAAGGHYPKASTHGRIALFLTIANAGYTLFCAFIIIASVVGSVCADTNRYYGYQTCGDYYNY